MEVKKLQEQKGGRKEDGGVQFLGLTSVSQSGDDDAASSSSGDHEAGLDDRDDGQTLGLRDHMSCNTPTTHTPLKTHNKIHLI